MFSSMYWNILPHNLNSPTGQSIFSCSSVSLYRQSFFSIKFQGKQTINSYFRLHQWLMRQVRKIYVYILFCIDIFNLYSITKLKINCIYLYIAQMRKRKIEMQNKVCFCLAFRRNVEWIIKNII